MALCSKQGGKRKKITFSGPSLNSSSVNDVASPLTLHRMSMDRLGEIHTKTKEDYYCVYRKRTTQNKKEREREERKRYER